MHNNGFSNKIKAHPLSAVLQTLICLLYLSVVVVSIWNNAFPFYLRWILFALATLLLAVQLLRLRSPLLLIDRIFAFKSGKQIVMAVFVFFISIDIGLCLFPTKGIRHTFIGFISYQHLGLEPQETLQFEPDNSGKDTTKYIPIKKTSSISSKEIFLKDVILWVLGTIVFNGLLIATINRYMATRADRFKQGANTYKNIKNHYVIVGYGNICVPIIRNILRRDNYDESSNFIILTNQSTEQIRRNIQTQLQNAEEKVVIYSGDMNSMTHLSRLNVDKALEVFILGEGQEPGRDSLNLECAKYIKELRAKKVSGDILHVNLQFDKPSSYSTIKRITIPKNYYMDGDRNVTYIRPFNFYENWSRLLWGTYHLDNYLQLDQGRIVDTDADGVHLSQRHVHLVIAGFEEMGTALLLEALRLCHYPNYNELTGENKTHITVLDPKMPSILPKFKAQYPYLSQIEDIDVEYKCGTIEDDSTRELIDKLANDEKVLLTVAICIHDSDDSLSAALTLPDSVYYHVQGHDIIKNRNTQVLVRQELRKGLADLLDEENGKFSNVRIFGTMDRGINDELLDDMMAKCVGAIYHCKYDLNPSVDFFELAETDWDKAREIAETNWANLNEDKRFANRYQVEMYKTYQTYRALLDQNPDILYQTEHLRWSAERSVAGYRNMSKEKIKSDIYQIHRLIIPYYELDALEKSKDKNVLVLMDKVLSLQKTI